MTGDAIKEEIVRHIEQSMPWPREDVRIEMETPGNLAEFSPSQAIVRVETVGKEDYLGEMTFRVRISEGNKQRQMNVRARLELLRGIIVSARALPLGTVVNPEDVVIKKKWVTRFDPLLLSSPEEVVGRQLSSSVRGGMRSKNPSFRIPCS